MGSPTIESLAKIGLHDHVCHIYRDPEERFSILTSYFRIGLSRGEKCLLFCSASDGEKMLSGLRDKGVDIGSALARGAVLVTQGPGARPGNGGLDPEDLVAFYRSCAGVAATEKHAGLRLCVDIAYALGKDALRDRLLKYHALLHSFLASQSALCLCLLGKDDLPADRLLDALRVHQTVIYGGKIARNFYFIPPTRDPGKVDASELFEYRLEQILEQHKRMTLLRRNAVRLARFRDIAGSLLAHESVPDLLNRIVEGVVALGYRMCWIGMALADGSIEPVASCGDRGGYALQISVRWDDSPLGNGPVGVAIRKGKPDIIRDTDCSQRFAPWREQAAATGYLSVAAVPIREEHRVIGALVVYSQDRDAFDREAVEELSAFVLQASLVLQRSREHRKLAESEARYRAAVEAGNVVVMEIDPLGKILLFNRAAECLTGCNAGEAIGRNYLSFFPEREKERTSETFRKVLAGQDAEGFVTAVLARDDSERMLMWNAATTFGGTGRGQCVIVFGVDISERLRLEKEKEDLLKSLANTKKMEGIGMIAGGIAHEFNNIFGAILGYADLVQTGKDADDPDLAPIRKIRSSVERAADLTKKMVGFARGGKDQVRSLTVNDLVANTLPPLQSHFDYSIAIRTLLDPSPAAVAGDEGQLQRSLLELCFNARDAMPHGGALTIRTGTERLSAEDAGRYYVKKAGDYVFLEVRDTGTGMTEEVRKRIFEPFFTTRKGYGHSGMGLASVYGIVKNHHGGIHLESVPGEGSVFRIYLPVAAHAEPVAAQIRAEHYPRGTETILIVDDEPEIRAVGSELLAVLGYRTITAEDGEAACRVFRERGREISLVLLDIIMPKMGGRETFRALRKMSPVLPVLLSSGYSVEGVAQEILDEGANGFIQKPYGMSELARMIRSILDIGGPELQGQTGIGA